MQERMLQLIANKQSRIPTELRPAIHGAVHRARRVYTELTGLNRSRKFFYEEALGSEVKRTLFQKLGVFYFAFALASKASKQVIDAQFRSWSDIVDANAGIPLIVRPVDIWDRTEECSVMLAKINRAWGNFDIPGTREQLIRLSLAVNEMIRMVDTMPDFETR